jgi:23S rRNA (guanine745-N1)-methyltransferase
VAPATLLCTVRGCRLPLTRVSRRLSCPNGHSFDVAHSGYVNLLQPQDRRSRRPGDSAEVLAARRRVLARVEARFVGDLIDLLAPVAGGAVLDVGCGEGQHLALIAERFGCEAHGIDISVAAIDAAARRHRRLEWIVANADRFVPYAEASFSLVLSITGRMNPGEFRRVLREGGTLLVVVSAPDDLVELRKAVLGEGVLRDRVERTVATFASRFTLERHARIRHVARLDAAAVADVMTSAYRALRAKERARLAAIGDIDVTQSRDVLLFRPG